MRTSSFAVLADADRRLVWRDPLLKWILLLPLGLALLLRVLIPRAHETLLGATGIDIEPYYPLVMGGYLMNGPGIVGMVIGFLLLDERDARTLNALRVTPVSIPRYLAYRISAPLLVATVTTLLGYEFIGITPLPLGQLLAISVVAGVSAPLTALVLATAAPNKVAGLALVKVFNGVNLLPIGAYFLSRPVQYLAGVIPTYWPMRAFWSASTGESFGVHLIIGTAVSSLALAVAVWLFERRLLRRG
jgi:fluoroquinolone transport system permease protein